jgi:hypothetical protein
VKSFSVEPLAPPEAVALEVGVSLGVELELDEVGRVGAAAALHEPVPAVTEIER